VRLGHCRERINNGRNLLFALRRTLATGRNAEGEHEHEGEREPNSTDQYEKSYHKRPSHCYRRMNGWDCKRINGEDRLRHGEQSCQRVQLSQGFSRSAPKTPSGPLAPDGKVALRKA